jgi:hypothetical protein
MRNLQLILDDKDIGFCLEGRPDLLDKKIEDIPPKLEEVLTLGEKQSFIFLKGFPLFSLMRLPEISTQ